MCLLCAPHGVDLAQSGSIILGSISAPVSEQQSLCVHIFGLGTQQRPDSLTRSTLTMRTKTAARCVCLVVCEVNTSQETRGEGYSLTVMVRYSFVLLKVMHC